MNKERYAIIVAGGRGLRMGGELPKQFLPLCGKPVLMRTLELFEGEVSRIILVLPEDHIPFWEEQPASTPYARGLATYHKRG